MKLIVGLGNPGIEYQFTLHNLGFLVVDLLASELGAAVANRRCRALTSKGKIGGCEVVLAKPETYMNLSGLSVRELVNDLEVDPARDLIVVHDELDLPFGTIRVRKKGGAAGNHGMESVIGALGTPEFVRVRLGISPGQKVVDGAGYVLAPIRKSQYEAIGQVVEAGAEAVKAIVTEGPEAAMNRFNRKDL
ncbi:MAG: aminoacyl-tRNA hydrolase [Terriglobales bacterium]|jgi:PTH1 family peptidyl-tRNA hydrolase